MIARLQFLAHQYVQQAYTQGNILSPLHLPQQIRSLHNTADLRQIKGSIVGWRICSAVLQTLSAILDRLVTFVETLSQNLYRDSII